VYTHAVNCLLDVISRMRACDVNCGEINSQASALQNEPRRLLKCELVSRGLEAFSRAQPEILGKGGLTLPDFVESARMRWPATSPTAFAASFSQSMAAAAPPHPGARWGEPEERERRRAEAEKENAEMATYHKEARAADEKMQNEQEAARWAQALKRAP